ncbi:hypothetical protein KR51_00029060 [Rubidibacter lacunae KORDI 51-2]|uniref:VCBS repeat-containing protein n=1 Tax=Rubidibacter lacunae KORDI 51-2 TaxID=582515 RepID=U5DJ16_9CHRO|nr:hypothetical protein [Rubidibacter lacunae]ERN40579.1 hypothetical protein KR51_00029060 [Rubidibacter lacunae KORDI 51-2]
MMQSKPQTLNRLGYALAMAIVLDCFALSDYSAAAERITVIRDGLRVELSYRDADTETLDLRLRVLRDGIVLLDADVPRGSLVHRPLANFIEGGLPVRDLNGDGEPEIVVDLYTGGAHCCTYSQIYSYNNAQSEYIALVHDWGSVGYNLRDLDGDGIAEFDSADDRFAYRFASFAGSSFPLQIWQLRAGAMVDVTRKFPAAIYSSAAQNWERYSSARSGGGEVKGALAAYLADKHSLNEGADGWQQVRAAYQKGDRAEFFAELNDFLRETGYTP